MHIGKGSIYECHAIFPINDRNACPALLDGGGEHIAMLVGRLTVRDIGDYHLNRGASPKSESFRTDLSRKFLPVAAPKDHLIMLRRIGFP